MTASATRPATKLERNAACNVRGCDILAACYKAAKAFDSERAIELAAKGELVFSNAGFARALSKFLCFKTTIDGFIVRAVLAGRDFVELLPDGQHYRIVRDSGIEVSTKRRHKGQIIEEGGNGTFERLIELRASNRYALVETLEQLARMFRATRRASVLESEGPSFVIMIGERTS